MTAKKTAEDLLNKFDCIIYTDQDHYSRVKKCALASVYEIIYALDYNQWQNKPIIDYYEKVKQEIEKYDTTGKNRA
jgi:protein-tyrosine-phosphatase